jgi:hypothetical protein
VRNYSVKWHGSFLVRCWRRETGPERIEVEHIQSGEKTLVASLAEAAAWMSDRSGERVPLPGGNDTREEAVVGRLDDREFGTRGGSDDS